MFCNSMYIILLINVIFCVKDTVLFKRVLSNRVFNIKLLPMVIPVTVRTNVIFYMFFCILCIGNNPGRQVGYAM